MCACMYDESPYLLAAGLSYLLYLIVFALDLLGMGLTQTLHLHFKTELGLKGKHKHTLHSPRLKETLFKFSTSICTKTLNINI